jgi:hypothetical protein
VIKFTGTPASSTTKTGRHDIAEILLKVELKHQKSNQIKSGQVYRGNRRKITEGISQAGYSFYSYPLSHNVVSSTPPHEQDSKSQL